MADDHPSSEATVQAGVAVDFSLRTPSLDEVEDICTRVILPNTLNPSSRNRRQDCKVSFHSLGEFGVMGIGYGTKITSRLHASEADDRIAFLMARNGIGQMQIGREEYSFTPQHGAIFSVGPEINLHYQENCETLALSLSRRKLTEQCAKLLGREVEDPIEFDRRFPLDTPAGASWQRLVHYVADELSHAHSMTRQLPAAQQQLEQMVNSAFLLGHSHTYSTALLQPQSAAAPYYVKRAEAYMEAHFTESLSLADIAAHAGVSARSLQSGFQSFRHMTPMAFLRSVRLQRVQKALLDADPAVSTVTEIALSCGFSHMGEFSTLYKKTFGVTPKETLLKISYR